RRRCGGQRDRNDNVCAPHLHSFRVALGPNTRNCQKSCAARAVTVLSTIAIDTQSETIAISAGRMEWSSARSSYGATAKPAEGRGRLNMLVSADQCPASIPSTAPGSRCPIGPRTLAKLLENKGKPVNYG